MFVLQTHGPPYTERQARKESPIHLLLSSQVIGQCFIGNHMKMKMKVQKIFFNNSSVLDWTATYS